MFLKGNRELNNLSSKRVPDLNNVTGKESPVSLSVEERDMNFELVSLVTRIQCKKKKYAGGFNTRCGYS